MMEVICCLSWVSVFFLSWLIILERTRLNVVNAFLWLFFLFVGLVSLSVLYKKYQKVEEDEDD